MSHHLVENDAFPSIRLLCLSCCRVYLISSDGKAIRDIAMQVMSSLILAIVVRLKSSM